MKLPILQERWDRWRKGRAFAERVRQLEKEAQKPRPLVPTLRRTLTIPSIGQRARFQGQGYLKVIEQVNSPLLNKLSFEIREQIYRLVVGEKYLHIVRKGKRLAFLFCQAQSYGSHDLDGCWGYEKFDCTFFVRKDGTYSSGSKCLWDNTDPKPTWTTDEGLLPLLIVCRKVYSESIQTVYSRNHFCFNSEDTWRLFRSTLPSQRIDSLRYLHIQLGVLNAMRVIGRGGSRRLHNIRLSLSMFRDEEEWIVFWKSIEDLKGLRILEVSLGEMPQCWKFRRQADWYSKMLGLEDTDSKDVLLDPLRRIGGLDKFMVQLPEPHPVKDGDPFTVMYPGEILERIAV